MSLTLYVLDDVCDQNKAARMQKVDSVVMDKIKKCDIIIIINIIVIVLIIINGVLLLISMYTVSHKKRATCFRL